MFDEIKKAAPAIGAALCAIAMSMSLVGCGALNGGKVAGDPVPSPGVKSENAGNVDPSVVVPDGVGDDCVIEPDFPYQAPSQRR